MDGALYREALQSSLEQMGFELVDKQRTVASLAQLERLGGLENLERGRTLLTLLNAHRVVLVRLVDDTADGEVAKVTVVERDELHRETVEVVNQSAIGAISGYLKGLPLFQEPRVVQVEPPRREPTERRVKRTPEQIKTEAWSKRGGAIWGNLALQMGWRYGVGRFISPFQWRGWVLHTRL